MYFNNRVGLLDLIFPKKCVGCGRVGNYLCPACVERIEYQEEQFCPECGRRAVFGATHPACLSKFGLDGLVSLTNYTSPMKQLIHQLKYRFVTDLLEEFEKSVLVEIVLLPGNWLLTPIPLHQRRQNFRGFNQAELMGKILAKKLKVGFKSGLILKTKATKPQVGLNRRERSKNLQEAFVVNQDLEGGDYLIFDDVWTSGATLKVAAQVLKKAGARRVWGLTLARPH